MQISRSEQKRRIKEVEKLVGELVKLPSQALMQAEGLEEIRDLLTEAADMEGSVRHRQIKHLTKFIAAMPLEPLYALVSQYRGKALSEKKQQHTIEFFRDAIINEALEVQRQFEEYGEGLTENWESETVAELQTQMPEIEPMTLSRLAYFFTRNRNPRYSREIFRYLKSVQELRQRNGESA
jgi:ribosome-associated protein